MAAKDGSFRSALLGGYNRHDVQTYVRKLEDEIEAMKFLHQKEKAALLRRTREAPDDKRRVEDLTAQLRRAEQEKEALRAELEKSSQALADSEKARLLYERQLEQKEEELRKLDAAPHCEETEPSPFDE